MRHAGVHQLGHFQHARRRDDGRGEQKRKPRRVGIVQAQAQTRDQRGPGARKPRNQGQRLRQTNEEGAQPAQFRQGDQPAPMLECIAAQQQQAIEHQRNRREGEAAEQRLDLVRQQQAEQPGWNGARHDQPEQTGVGVGRLAASAQPATDQPRPVAPEIDQQRGGRAQMQHHDEGQKPVCRAVDGPMKQGRNQNAVPQAGNGKQLGHALKGGDGQKVEVHGVVRGCGFVAQILTEAHLDSSEAAVFVALFYAFGVTPRSFAIFTLPPLLRGWNERVDLG
ncbi:hypothetical protein THICB1_150074 [Thiomonas arsenitoxydans]|uniref:Uncharacterized protein n=1 Tax=Thiomonas arsenitoxydans (strain DSM 22701 / CIP 110005 / 3As) TaxID=426114 RepID=A0ABP1Z133_THIA3|nr:hypothetical protein ACO7_130025 [Thiomonas arsenitoxydans]CQR29099.1 hypothetical protein ACO3_150006 [Thiomonas arsenitoxydans]CQR30606.1 hypothetical protein THICB1_150074 [Thiomonas arsenitoxydans]CQR35560.1 hypothetical protein THICB6_230039 [Thiomonas arsenitoxydans]